MAYILWVVVALWILTLVQIIRVAWAKRCRACGAMGPCRIGCYREDCLR